MEIRITPFKNGNEVSLELEEFWPREGYAKFLRSFCSEAGGDFIDWHQGVESGIGHISFENQRLTVFWSDFPDAFSFDCTSQKQAERLKGLVERYFARHGLYH